MPGQSSDESVMNVACNLLLSLCHSRFGLIKASLCSSPTGLLHPVPLYFLFGYLAFLGLALLSLNRFIVEYFRDPYSNQMLADAWMGLKGVQSKAN